MLQPSDAALVKRDPTVPGLAVLLDNEAASQQFQSAFPDLGILAAEATYVRYKPLTSCLVRYELKCEDGVELAYAHAYPQSASAKLEKAKTHFMENAVALCQDKAMIYYRFPYDRKLGALPSLIIKDERSRFFEKLFKNNSTLWQADLSPLVYKPERRFVAQAQSGRHKAIVKLYNKADFLKAYANAKHFNSTDAFQVAKRLGHSKRHQLLAFEFVEGQLLPGVFQVSTDPTPLVEVGAALAALHKQPSQDLKLRTRSQEMARVFALASYLAWLLPQLEDRLSDLAFRLCQKFEQLSQYEYAVHGDFYGKQILLMDQGLCVLDFDEAYRGDPTHDLGLFIAHQECDMLRGMLLADIEKAKNSFLCGYERTAKALPAHIDFYVATELLGLMPHFFRNREADWVVQSERLLERSEELVYSTQAQKQVTQWY